MAKDPAFLFYPGDWQGGTATLNRHLKGCYIDLLIAQFNNGPLSLDEIKTVLGTDFQQAWPTLKKKFKVTDENLFFNERLATEQKKRAEHSQKQKDRIKDYWDRKKNVFQNTAVSTEANTGEVPLEDRIENENENRNIKGVQGDFWKDVSYPFNSEAFMEAWQRWVNYRIEIKKPYHTFSSVTVELQELAKHPEAHAIDMINVALKNCWKNIRQLEPQQKTGGSKLDAVLTNDQIQEQILKTKYGK